MPEQSDLKRSSGDAGEKKCSFLLKLANTGGETTVSGRFGLSGVLPAHTSLSTVYSHKYNTTQWTILRMLSTLRPTSQPKLQFLPAANDILKSISFGGRTVR